MMVCAGAFGNTLSCVLMSKFPSQSILHGLTNLASYGVLLAVHLLLQLPECIGITHAHCLLLLRVSHVEQA